MLIIKLIYAIAFIFLGIWLIKYRRNVKSWTWNFVRAERYIWNGWTYLVFIAFWLFLIFLGVIYPFWWLNLIFWE